MRTFSHIDNEEMHPNEIQHVEYAEVYRATQNVSKLMINDFLPWNIEHANQAKTFKKQLKQTDYGMSVFTNLDSLKETVLKYPAIDESTNSYSKGFTTIKRGISFAESVNHHVDYFLYDYMNNSPKDDFEIVEVRKKS